MEKVKRQVCVACWGFINTLQEKISHPEHKDYIMGPHVIKDEHTFMLFAQQHGKINGTKIAILNNKCVFADGLGGGVGEENSHLYSIVPQVRPSIKVTNEIYTNCTQELYDLDEFENPDNRFLPKDPDA